MKRFSPVVFTSLLIMPLSGLAAHSDVEVGVNNGKLIIESAVPVDQTTGNKIFEVEMGELVPFTTDDPGYEVLDGVFQPDQILGYEAKGALQFFNPTTKAWENTVTDAEQIHILDALTADTIVSPAGIFGDIQGLIAAADSGGGIHAHIDYELENDGGVGDPATGAYMIELALTGFESDQVTTAYTDSDNFYIAFNNGMPEVEFEEAIETLTGTTSNNCATTPILLFGLVGGKRLLSRRRKKIS